MRAEFPSTRNASGLRFLESFDWPELLRATAANEHLEGRRVNVLTFVNPDRAANLRVEAHVEARVKARVEALGWLRPDRVRVVM